MRLLAKKLKINVGKKTAAAFIILWLYTWIVFMLKAIKIGADITWLYAAFWGIFSAGISIFAFYILNKLMWFKFNEQTPSKKECILCWIYAFLITFIFVMIFWGPQLFYKLPLLTGHGLGLIVFLQLLYFCLAFSYLIYVLYRNGCPKWLLIISCVYIWINPFYINEMMFPWKDHAFTIFAILLVAYYIQIIASKGVWLQKKTNILLFSIGAVVCTYMRHNAILFVAPLVIIALLYVPLKRSIKIGIVLSLLVGCVFVKGLYSYLNVAEPSGRTLETVGLPATVWCNVMQKNPDALPKETQEVMYGLATPEAYKEIYKTGNFSSIKWTGIDKLKVDDMSYKEVLNYTWQCFRYAPKESIEAVAVLTSMVWQMGRMGSLQSVGFNIKQWVISLFGLAKDMFSSFGIMIWILLAVGLALFAKGRMAFMHIIPLFCYDFGTMLLLSGPDYRFFVLNTSLWIPLILLMYMDKTMLPKWRKSIRQ